mgnify:CR=1 FL=1
MRAARGQRFHDRVRLAQGSVRTRTITLDLANELARQTNQPPVSAGKAFDDDPHLFALLNMSHFSEAVTETVWGAEDHTDLKNVARRRFRDERSPRYTHSHRANPHLRQYDVAATTDPTWQHAGRSMYLAGYSLALDASTTGGLDEDFVWVVPLPAYDPGVELEAA